MLTIHILGAGAWIGIDVALGVLVFTARSATSTGTEALAYQALELFAVWPLLTAGFVTLLSGIVLGLGTTYGLVKHWWVAVKLALNLVLVTLVAFALRAAVSEAASYGEALAAGTPTDASVDRLSCHQSFRRQPSSPPRCCRCTSRGAESAGLRPDLHPLRLVEGREKRRQSMKDQSTRLGGPAARATNANAPDLPAAGDRATFQAELDRLRVREKAHTREGDAIAAARRRLPMVEVDPNLELIGPNGQLTLLEAFEGRRQLIAYTFMWHIDHPAAEQCQGCTWCTSQVGELCYLHSPDITFAVFCQGPYDESSRYRDFMGWDMPWYSARASLDALLLGREGRMHLICYARDGDRVFETYWTTGRGVEEMDYSYALMDLTVHGRQEAWQDSPPGWPQQWPPDAPKIINGRPIAQWSRIEAGRSDDLAVGP